MNLSLAVALASLALIAAPLRAQTEGVDARIAAVSGDVAVYPADGSAEASAEAGMPLEEGDRVVAAEGGSAEIALDGASLITVRERSDFKIEKAVDGESSFFLQAGALLAKIQKLGERRLRVRTPTAVVAVRGTEFGVEVDEAATHVGVFDEGKVSVSGESGEPETLISNQETSVLIGQPPSRATQLQRFARHRSLMRGHARRLAMIRAKWKTLGQGQRRELRQEAIERMRGQRVKMIEKRKQALKDADGSGKRREMMQKQRRDMMENRRKMEERRQRIPRRQGP